MVIRDNLLKLPQYGSITLIYIIICNIVVYILFNIILCGSVIWQDIAQVSENTHAAHAMSCHITWSPIK